MFRFLKATALALAVSAAAIAASFAYTEDPMVHSGTKIIPPRECSDTQNQCYIRVKVNFNDPNIATGLWFATLPKNAYILKIDVDTTVAWNAATTNVLTFGATRTSANEVIADGASATANISNSTTTIATGILHLTTALGLGTAITGNSTYQTGQNGGIPLYVKYTQTGTAASTGSTTVVFVYAMDNDN